MSEDAAASLPSPSSNTNSNDTPAHSPTPPLESDHGSFSHSSSSRVINPAPIATRVTPKVALATASSPPLDYGQSSPVGGGPTSTSYVVPPRPKPGRKPATDEPASKRKAQNRESQRAFRARKAAKLTEMQSQVESAEQRHRQEINEKMMELNEKELRINQLETLVTQLKEAEKRSTQERDYWKEKFHQAVQQDDMLKRRPSLAALQQEEMLKRRSSLTGWDDGHPDFFQRMPGSRQDSLNQQSLSAFSPLATSPHDYDTPKSGEIGCGNCKVGGPCACMEEMAKFTAPVFTPAVTFPHRQSSSRRPSFDQMKGVQVHGSGMDLAAMFADREIDFTAQFAKRARLDTRPSIEFITAPNEPDRSCGFCTDDSNCVCKDTSLQRNNEEMAPPVLTSPNDCVSTGPGTCSDCMRDPKQKAWCQRVAQLKGTSDYFSDSPVSRTSSVSSGIDPLEPRTNYAPTTGVAGMNQSNRHTIGCSEAYKLFQGRVPTDSEHTNWSTLKPISASARTESNSSLPSIRTYSALELDTAGVIATLQQTMGPLTPRNEDGDYKHLVEIAKGHRMSGNPQG